MGRRIRELTAPVVMPGPAGVSIRDRLRHLTDEDELVLRLTGEHLGRLASRDLRQRCADGLEHSADTWAARKRALTSESSSRWAGSITKASHDQWALARRGQAAHIHKLESGIRTLRHRLSQPLAAAGTKRAPGGYRDSEEWFRKSRRLHTLEARLEAVRADWESGTVHVVRGGRRLLNTRHHLDVAQSTEADWRRQWEAERWFMAADGESGKRYGNETIRVTPGGRISLKLPAPLAHLANDRNGRYVLTAAVRFQHRGQEWADRIEQDRAVAYRIHFDPERGRWYFTASWQRPTVRAIPLESVRARGMVGVDTNADHLAAYRLDRHGNPLGEPRRFFFDLSGNARHRDAQVRHALTRLLHWAKRCGSTAIAVENLDLEGKKGREHHGRRRWLRQLISGMPTARLRNRLIAMACELGLTIVAVDPAYTSRWGAQHWQKPLTTEKRCMTRHDAAAVAIGRRALGHTVRRRTAPPRDDRSDRRGHRTVQAGPAAREREEPRRPVTDRALDARHRSGTPRTRGTSAPNTVRDARSVSM